MQKLARLSNVARCSCLFSHLSLEVSSMTDEERDQIDTDAETYMRTCSVAIQSLKTEGTVRI